MSDPVDLRSARALAGAGGFPAARHAWRAGTRHGPRYDHRMRIAGLTHLGDRSPCPTRAGARPAREALLVWEWEGGATG